MRTCDDCDAPAAPESAANRSGSLAFYAYRPIYDLRRKRGNGCKIRAGYEISYDCPQPTPMILTLSVHPSRMSDLLTADRMRLNPPIPAKTYHDSFGNFCHVIRAPTGRLTISTDFLVQDKGEPDAVGAVGGAACSRRAAGGGPDLSARQPILRDRSPIECGMVPVRTYSEGLAARAGDLRLCPRSHHLRLRTTPARPRQRGTLIPSAAACAGTSPTLRSHYAAA